MSPFRLNRNVGKIFQINYYQLTKKTDNKLENVFYDFLDINILAILNIIKLNQL